MSTVTVMEFIPAPAADLWRVFTDLPARAEWLSTVERVDLLTTTPFAAGTAWRETRRMPGGALASEEFFVVESDPPRCCTISSPGIGADYRMTYKFSPVEVGRHRGCTAVTVIQDGAPTAPAGRLLAFVFGGLAARTVEGAFRRDLADLAAAVARLGGDPAAAA